MIIFFWISLLDHNIITMAGNSIDLSQEIKIFLKKIKGKKTEAFQPFKTQAGIKVSKK